MITDNNFVIYKDIVAFNNDGYDSNIGVYKY